jgi:uncharacterized delta-60 repeat protein
MKSIIGKKINTVSSPKIIAGGTFTTYNGSSQNRIIRLNADGTIDTSFVIGTGFNTGTALGILTQSDGKIVVGGSFTAYNGTAQNYITRLNSNGTRDTSFTIGTGFNNLTRAIAIQSDGKIVAGGNFTSYNGTTQNRITRLNSDGTRDTSFTIGTGFNLGQINSVAIQSDGKIVAGGNFTSYNGTFQSRITRLNSNGTRDTSFTIGTGIGSLSPNVIKVIIQPNGKILVGGRFSSYNNTTSNSIVRLNSDGSIDTSFTTGAGMSAGNVTTLAIQSDGKIVVGGTFTDYNGVTDQNYIIRLNVDGTLDDTFLAYPGFNNSVNALRVESNDKILVGGNFTAFQGMGQYSMIRLNADGTQDTSFTINYSLEINSNIFAIT